jgi:hypothetical protein
MGTNSENFLLALGHRVASERSDLNSVRETFQALKSGQLPMGTCSHKWTSRN